MYLFSISNIYSDQSFTFTRVNLRIRYKIVSIENAKLLVTVDNGRLSNRVFVALPVVCLCQPLVTIGRGNIIYYLLMRTRLLQRSQ